MGPDPVSALSLASNVVQFIEFVSKLISKGYKYYESADGALIEHSEQAAVAANLVNLTYGLDHSLAAFATGKNDFAAWAQEKAQDLLLPKGVSAKQKTKQKAQQAPTLVRLTADERKVQKTLASSEERALHQVTAECRRAAEEFIEVLNGLKVKGSHRGWQSFRQAFKSIWGKDKIEAMLKKLGGLREQLMIHLLVAMSNRQLQSLAVLTNANEHMERNILNAIPRGNNLSESQRVEQSILGLVHEIQRGFIDMRMEQAEQKRGHREAHDRKTQQFSDDWQTEVQHSIARIIERLKTTIETQKHDAMKQRMLDSLYFTQIEERRSKIPEAHAKTFKWVFKQQHHTRTLWTSFAGWCRESDTHDNLFWVAGKAGSGKSTLMRYLYDNRETQAHLQDWAGLKKLVMAKCFFWNPGTEIQKSWVGLLRSLLYDLLQQLPDFIPSVAPARWRSYEFGTRQLDTWADSELFDAFHSLVREASQNMCICLFVDGLDEFEGSDDQHLDLTEFFKNIASSPNVKVCVSSRPWLVFQDQFAKRPQLLLEDLTREDIGNYVQDKLEQHDRFQALKSCNSESCMQLVLEIVGRARGVFLWVYLVVRSLQHGLRNEDGIPDLMRRLRTIPTDLEPYFEQMMTTIDPFYRSQAMALFRLALSAPRPLSLMTVSFLHEYQDDPEFALTTPLRIVSDEQVHSRLLSMKRRLNSRCKDLLEVYPTRYGGLFLQQIVDFMHRTVRDFLMTKEAQQILDSYSAEPIDAHIFIFSSLTAQIKMLDIKDVKSPNSTNPDDFLELLDEVLCYAEDIESLTNKLPLSLMLDLDIACTTHHKKCGGMTLTRSSREPLDIMREWWDSPQEWTNSLLTLMIQTGRTSYAKAAIQSARPLVMERIGRPLLDSALRRRLNGRTGLAPDIELVRTIVSQGGDPNQSFEGTSVWTKFLVHIVDKGQNDGEKWLQAAEFLIRNGAARKFPARRKNRDGTDTERSYSQAVYHTPYDMLCARFGDKVANRLDGLARRRQYSGRNLVTRTTSVAEKARARPGSEEGHILSRWSAFGCLYR